MYDFIVWRFLLLFTCFLMQGAKAKEQTCKPPDSTLDRIVEVEGVAEKYLGVPLPKLGKIFYYLYTPNNTETPEKIDFENIKGTTTNFDPNLDLKILVHGFIDGSWLTSWQIRMKDIFLEVGRFNVIILDWSLAGAVSVDYYITSISLQYRTASHLAKLISCLMVIHDIKYEQIHLIGHSLGGQLVGNTGHFLGGKIGWISVGKKLLTSFIAAPGLDPAGVVMDKFPPSLRISPDDAQFVDVTHTNALILGSKFNLGDIDFFVNGGYFQKECQANAMVDTKEKTTYELVGNLVHPQCDHLFSIYIYLYSINPNNTQCIGHACKDLATYDSGKCEFCDSPCSCIPVGYEAREYASCVNSTEATKFYVSTNQHTPYCPTEKTKNRRK